MYNLDVIFKDETGKVPISYAQVEDYSMGEGMLAVVMFGERVSYISLSLIANIEAEYVDAVVAH